jgi:MoaA/NifB/PqqE/SkfB family radical SAM enzyme
MEGGATVKEWSKEYNSFNSWKGLLYSDWYKGIKNRHFLPPLEASLDPIHSCNLECEHCNAYSYLSDGAGKRMTDEHIINLVRFLGRWGVKAICFGGGGEPTLHTKLPEAIQETYIAGMEASVATNGTLFNDVLLEALKLCRWVGVSIDSATPETYRIGRKADMFHQAIQNLEKLARNPGKCDVAYKFLVMPYNQHEIYQACKLAKEIGVKDFHARPADYSHQGMGEKKQSDNQFNIENIIEQFEKCHELEDENFRVFTVIHKFNGDFRPAKQFSQCYASPLCIQLCADGNAYLCPDQRQQEYYKLGEHYPDPNNILNFWGGSRHQHLVFDIGAQNCNTRCTYAPYNKQCEQLFINESDPMCWRFC